MAHIETDRLYTAEHEWVRVDPDDPTLVTLGVSDYAQSQLGDIVMVELPAVGDPVEKDAVLGSLESPKSVSDIFSPASGEVVELNEALEMSPEHINEDPYGDGWMVKLHVDEPTDLDELMIAAEYERFLDSLDED